MLIHPYTICQKHIFYSEILTDSESLKFEKIIRKVHIICRDENNGEKFCLYQFKLNTVHNKPFYPVYPSDGGPTKYWYLIYIYDTIDKLMINSEAENLSVDELERVIDSYIYNFNTHGQIYNNVFIPQFSTVPLKHQHVKMFLRKENRRLRKLKQSPQHPAQIHQAILTKEPTDINDKNGTAVQCIDYTIHLTNNQSRRGYYIVFDSENKLLKRQINHMQILPLHLV